MTGPPVTATAPPERRPGSARLLARRVAVALAQFAAVSVIVFALTTLLPGDTADVVLGPDATDDQVTVLRTELGLDRPATERFLDWAGGLPTGDLGRSLVTGQPVAGELAARLGSTALLGGLALALLVPAAVTLGVIAGRRPGSAPVFPKAYV